MEEVLIRAYISSMDNHHLNKMEYEIERIVDDDVDYPHEIIAHCRYDTYKDKIYISRLSLIAFVYDQLKKK